jgi:uncharacterized protein
VAVFWDLATSRVLGTVDVRDGCGLAPAERPGAFRVTAGCGHARWVDLLADQVTPLPTRVVADARWDNHIAIAREPE